jgi:UDP-3-O-acyl-N-acetylglucosamine deacetylase
MAALFGLGVDNCRVEVDTVEMPAGDGSATAYVAALRDAGIREQEAARRPLWIDRPYCVAREDALLCAAPHEEALVVTYVLDYGEAYFGSQSATVTVDEATFIREIAPARTYCLRPEIDLFRKLGLGGGASEANTVVVEPDGSLPDDARFPDECARHKILDLLGDLYLAGRLASGRLMGYKSGHALNARMAQALFKAGGAV